MTVSLGDPKFPRQVGDTEGPFWGVIFRGNPIDFFAPLSNLFKTVALLRPHNEKFVVYKFGFHESVFCVFNELGTDVITQ